MTDDARNVAVLIDFENLNEKESLESVVEHGAKHGNIVIKLAVGNFSVGGDGQRRLQELGIQPVHQSTAGKGKNSSDMRMAIEAINLFHRPSIPIDVFVLATSDVDFMPLAQWLRASGKRVIGAGRSDALELWQRGVDEFVVVKDVNSEQNAVPTNVATATKAAAKSPTPKAKKLSKAHRRIIDEVINGLITEGSKPISNSEFLKRIRKKDPSFSSKTHGFSSIRKVVESIETLHIPSSEPKIGNFMIHIRKRKDKTST